jgi:hypothetical protein
MLLSLPLGAQASAPPPEVSTFSYTSNLEPIGASSVPAGGPTRSDIAFWGDKAYQGSYTGFRIIDISNPASPTELIDYQDCRGSQGDVILWENILVRSWNGPAQPSGTPPAPPQCDGTTVQIGFEGLHIFDVSDPTDPDLIASVNIPTCGSHTATGVPDVANNRLLVYNNPSSAGNCAGFDIVQIPLNNPSSPTILGRAATGRSCHDTAVILGEAMLAACAGGNGLTMMSIGGSRGGSLTSPVQLWTKSLTDVSIGHAATFSWDGEIVVFGHEPGGGTAAECEATDADVKKTTFFFNAVDGTELGRHVLPRPQTAQENCTIHNMNTVPTGARRIAIQGNYQAGIAVLDFTDPANVKEIAYADPAPLNPNAIQTGGDWSTHWYDGEIYESDITRGLITWLLNDPAVAGAQTLGHLNPQTQEFTIPFTGSLGKCKGKAVTILGSDSDELLKGTSGVDVILANGGNDTISAKKGNDVVCGGAGNDVLRGGSGNDKLLGQAGNDTGKGGSGVDTFKGGPGQDKGSGNEKGRL